MRRLLLSLAIAAAMAGAACGDPPDKEMQQAQGAIDAARAAGADQYAREEFTAAEEALKKSHEAVEQRDYRQALNTALDARERAQAAAKESVNRKATARADATKALADADAALHNSRAKLKAAEAAHLAPRTLAAGRKAIDNGENAVQEARTAFDKGDYLAAIERARSRQPGEAAIAEQLAELDAALDELAKLLDASVLAFTVAAMFIAAVGSGLLPAWMSSRAGVVGALKEGGRGNTTRSVGMVTRGLVVFQIGAFRLMIAGAVLGVARSSLPAMHVVRAARHLLTWTAA